MIDLNYARFVLELTNQEYDGNIKECVQQISIQSGC
jgi:hypothetical protein